MAARSKARRRALDILYAAEMRSENAGEALDRAVAAGEGPTNAYTATLVRGVVERAARIDELLTSYSTAWTLDRMPSVDRTALRIGVWELLYADDVPDPVAITEAMVLVRELSTDESPQFVNGVLGAIQRHKPSLI